MPSSETYERIIWSADVASDEELLAVLRQVNRPIKVKIDRLYVRRNGDAIFGAINDAGYQVFNDAKLIEIPSKLANLAKEEIERTQPWMLNCMAGSVSNLIGTHDQQAKRDGLKQFADICHEHGVLPCAVTVLTSKTTEVSRKEFGTEAVDQVLTYAQWLVDFGYTDMVCSPDEAAAVRGMFELNALNLNTPGVRMPGDAIGDQGRVATPGQAARNGADRVVIGRPITESDDPAATIDAIARDIESLASPF